MDKKSGKLKKVSRMVGYIFGIVCVTCLATIAIASTVAFVLWIF